MPDHPGATLPSPTHLPPETHGAHTQTCSCTFSGRADQVPRVRVFLARVVDGCPAAADAVLMADELATNAVLHSRSGRDGGMFTVHVEVCERAWLRVSVQDEGGLAPPLLRASSHPGSADGGRGLRIVSALSDTWGVTGDVTGRAVWFQRAWESG